MSLFFTDRRKNSCHYSLLDVILDRHIGQTIKKVMHFNKPVILTEKNTVAPSAGSVCHLEVILIEDLLVMTV